MHDEVFELKSATTCLKKRVTLIGVDDLPSWKVVTGDITLFGYGLRKFVIQRIDVYVAISCTKNKPQGYFDKLVPALRAIQGF